jgi:hypothetical protein
MGLVIRLVTLALALAVVGSALAIGFFWYDGSQMMAHARSSGWLTPKPDEAPMTMFESTVAKAIYGETWDKTAFPCRTAASFLGYYTGNKPPRGIPVSLIMARDISYEVEATQSLRSQVRQLSLACALEREHGDAELLRLWLRRASFGNSLTGPDAAAQAVFRKTPRELGAAESARLAALLSWPDLWSQQDQWDMRAQKIAARASAN